MHELAHIWIAQTGLSNDIEPSRAENLYPIESFCNSVAANALIPNQIISNMNKEDFKNSKNIFKVAKKLGVSSLALLIRAFNLKKNSLPTYQKLKQEAENDY